MHRRGFARLIGVAALALTTVASAQPAPPPDLFGFDPAPAPAAPAGCDPASELGCPFSPEALAATASPFALTTVLTRARWEALAGADLEHDAIVPFALGAARDDAGVFFAGASGLENRWLVEGAPTESLHTGGVDTRIPLAFIERITVTAGGFAAADRASTGGAIDVSLVRGGDHHAISTELWASAATARATLPGEPLRYQPAIGTVADLRALSVSVVARGPIGRLAGARIWYAAGVRPVLRDDGFRRDFHRLVDADADGAPDLDAALVPITEPIESRSTRELAYSVPVLARVGAERGHHTLELTGLVTPYRDTRYETIATDAAGAIRRRGATVDGIATWRGVWATTRARVIASWHRRAFDEAPRRGDPAAVQTGLGFIPSPVDLDEDPALAAACDDTAGTDAYPGIPNCPVSTFFLRGGAGLLIGQTADRPALSADVAHRLGAHTVAAGIAGEDGRLVNRLGYTGGARAFSLFDGFTLTRRFVEVGTGPDTVPCDDDPAATARCRTIDQARTTVRARQLAAYLADDWRPRADVAFTAGLRWESMELGDAFAFRDQLAPRLGLAWDPLGGGASRVFAGYGRAFAVMPARLGEVTGRRPASIDDADLGGFHTLSFDAGNPTVRVDPGLAPVLTEELTAGVDVVLRAAVRLTAWAQVRWLRRGIEDRPDPERPGHLLLANPTDPSATRRSSLLALELATAPGTRFGLRVQYQYARSVGATTGPYDPINNGVPYATEDFDTGLDAANLTGRLPSDLRHRAAVEATARLRVGPVPVVVGLRAQLGSGRPLDAYAVDTERMYLVARGSAGRLGLVTTTNLHLAADLGHGVELVADVLNLFDRQRAIAVDERYTTAPVVPVAGGRSEDLVFLKDEEGAPVIRSRGYGRPIARQAPLSAAIGVRARF